MKKWKKKSLRKLKGISSNMEYVWHCSLVAACSVLPAKRLNPTSSCLAKIIQSLFFVETVQAICKLHKGKKK